MLSVTDNYVYLPPLYYGFYFNQSIFSVYVVFYVVTYVEGLNLSNTFILSHKIS